tara:strand:- start:34 stop:792 length:759 start_codon:yes stop_codon:yes gene_type:complete
MDREITVSIHSNTNKEYQLMNIYQDFISKALGMSPLPQDQLAKMNADCVQQLKHGDKTGWGGATWRKETFPDHPFVGSEFQNKRVEEGTHHLLGGVTVVGLSGDIVRIDFDEYKNQFDYVHISTDEAYIRRGLDPTKDRKTNLGKKMPLNDDSPQKLKGDNRTQAQKEASKRHSEYQRKNAIMPTPKGSKLSEEHRQALRVSRPGAGQHGNQLKGDKHPGKIQVTCPHCSKTGHAAGMNRWHMDNCKMKITK